LGYAVTVHSAQGATADTSIAVLREDASRNLLYVAMTRGRHTNHAHIYERCTEATEFTHEELGGAHVTERGDSAEAAVLLHGILSNDELAVTAHDYARQHVGDALPPRIRDLLESHAAATNYRRDAYQVWQSRTREQGRSRDDAQERAIDTSRYHGEDYGLEL
jgi:hypothetical protein